MKTSTTTSKPAPPIASPTLLKQDVLNAVIDQITTLYAKNEAAAQEGLLNAMKCGLLFTAAKDLVGHGNFETWWETSTFIFSRATRCKYMQLSEQFSAEANVEESPVLKVEYTGDKASPIKFQFNEKALAEMVTTVSAGRNLSDLYLDWNIVKSTAGKTPSKTARNSAKGQPTTLKLETWFTQSEQVPEVFITLKPEMQSEIVSRLQILLTKLLEMQSTVQNQSPTNPLAKE